MRIGPTSQLVRVLVRDTGCTVQEAIDAAKAAKGDYFAAFHALSRRVPR